MRKLCLAPKTLFMPRLRNTPGYPYTRPGMERAVRTYMGAKRRFVDVPPRPPVVIPADLQGYVQAGGGFRSMAERKTELKWLDTVLAPTVLANTDMALISSVNLMQQGSGESDRVGKRVRLKQIFVRGNIVLDEPGSVSSSMFSLFVILDKQANGLNPDAATVFNPLYPPAQVMLNMENAQRFVVLKAFTRELASMTYNSGLEVYSYRNFPFEFVINCDIPIDFAEADPTVLASVRSNNVFVCYGTDTNGVDTVTPAMTIRVRYTDN